MVFFLLSTYRLVVVCILVLHLSSLCRCTTRSTYDLRVVLNEESPQGTVVADMINIFGLLWSDRDGRTFKLLEQKITSSSSHINAPPSNKRKLVQLDDRTGMITLRHRVDREKECGKSKECMIIVQAVMLPQRVFSLLNLEIVIQDINDHTPTFPIRPIAVNISESAAIGDVISIDQYQARDLDAGNNSIIEYSLAFNEYMGLHQFVDEVGRSHLQLVVKQKLDYEEKHVHHLTLTATDKGKPPRTDHVTVRVHVTDANDNNPVFEESEYMVALRENMRPGNIITNVRATDADSGVNGMLQYYLADEVQSKGSKPLVAVNEITGAVSLREKLDRETHDGIKILIEASDMSDTNRRTARTWLILNVEDVNDNSPTIKVNFIVDSNDATAYISEASPIGTYVAYVSASDADHGSNGDVTTTIATKRLDEQGLYYGDSGLFMLANDGLIGTGRTLDRETENSYLVVISSCDGGQPSKCSIKNISIEILDENDHVPIFPQAVYSVTIPENADVGTYVTTVSASDADSLKAPVKWINKDGEIEASKNGDIKFSIKGGDNSFTINSRSGKITLVRSLDYEGSSEKKITILAKDGGRPVGKESSAVVHVKVTDVNDNRPIFTNPAMNNSTVHATILTNDIITRIQTIDYDSENGNGHVTLELVTVDGQARGQIVEGEEPYSYFILNPISGDLILNRSRDEIVTLVGQHEIIVKATDSGKPSLSSTTTITIMVSDSLLPKFLQYDETKNGNQATSLPMSMELLVIVISLSVASLILCIVIAVVIIKCRKDNKKVRTYNCRDAESKSGWLSSQRNVNQSVNDVTNASTWLKSVASGDETSQLAEAERSESNSQNCKSKRLGSDSGFSGTHTSFNEESITSRHDMVSTYHVTATLPKQANPLSTFSSDGKVAHAKIVGLLQQGVTDQDSGRGDSDPDSGSFTGNNERDCPKLYDAPVSLSPLSSYDYESHAKPRTRCTEECRLYGHSDLCWMPSPTKDNFYQRQEQCDARASPYPQQNYSANDFQSEYNRVLDTIEETPSPVESPLGYEYDTDSMRENVRRSLCLPRLQIQPTGHQDPYNLPRQYDAVFADEYNFSRTPHLIHSLSPSPAPSSGLTSSHLSSNCPSTTNTFYSDSTNTIFHNDHYMTVTSKPFIQRSHIESTGSVSMQETQQIINDIDKLLTETR